MFISRGEFDRVVARQRELERRLTGHDSRFRQHEEEIKKLNGGLKEIHEHVGSDRSGWLTFSFRGAPIEKFNLTEKVQALMDHLGLQELAEGTNKLVPKPVTKKPRSRK